MTSELRFDRSMPRKLRFGLFGLGEGGGGVETGALVGNTNAGCGSEAWRATCSGAGRVKKAGDDGEGIAGGLWAALSFDLPTEPPPPAILRNRCETDEPPEAPSDWVPSPSGRSVVLTLAVVEISCGDEIFGIRRIDLVLERSPILGIDGDSGAVQQERRSRACQHRSRIKIKNPAHSLLSSRIVASAASILAR